MFVFLLQEQEPPKALPLEEAAISLQQLFQLSVSIAFNFLGNWTGLVSRQGWEQGRSVEGVSNTVRGELLKEEILFSPRLVAQMLAQ